MPCSTPADRFHMLLCPLGLQPGHLGQFDGADRREILEMAGQDAPVPAQIVMQTKFADGAVLFEVRRELSKLDRHGVLLLSPCRRCIAVERGGGTLRNRRIWGKRQSPPRPCLVPAIEASVSPCGTFPLSGILI